MPLPTPEPTHHGGGPRFGWSATVRRARPAPGEREVEVHRATVTPAAVLRAAALVPHAEAVVVLESYDRDAYVRAFGWGRM